MESRTFIKKLQTFMGSRLALWIILGLFVAQAGTLAVITHIGTPPDENNHIDFIEYYADHSLSPFFKHQTPTSHLGDKTREVDYLYHYTASLLYRVSPLPTHGKYIMLRLITVGLALLTMLVLAHLFRRVGVGNGVINGALLIITNIPMVLMMSSAINNDIFVWLGMVLGLLLLLRLWQKPKTLDFLWLLVLCVAGGLVKRNLLVIGFYFGILALIVLIRHFKTIMQGFKKFDWRIALAVVALVVSLGLFAERVGGNLIAYHTPTPTCEQVQGVEPCKVFWGSAREKGLITHRNDPIMSPPVFVAQWTSASIYNIFDIQSQFWRHQVVPSLPTVYILGFILLIGLLLGFGVERHKFKTDKTSQYRVVILAAALVYVGAQMLVNYNTYLDYHVFGVALNGRYLLPSIILLVPLAAFYWATVLRKRPWLLAALTVLVVAGVIFGSGFIMMLRNTQLVTG